MARRGGAVLGSLLLAVVVVLGVGAVAESYVMMPKDPYESDGSYSAAKQLTKNKAQIRTLDTASDKDWVKFYALVNSTVKVSVTKPSYGLKAKVTLYTGDGRTMIARGTSWTSTASSAGASVSFKVLTTGYYFAEVASTGSPGLYLLALE